ncbi:FAD binding domain-containing protein [Lacisediminihabitans changchengi]|uniref:FAD binding domain-containing protein n=1 Tax=Lacisediminihabitans changchengi TaxID=2787634 RepID=A0A934W0Y5_9MICO|nr:FAD binding domain-containing protein [Lacisediminihabitans changchengi]MBK4346323.1 FAD binding domain-containing protein [Lacisediminihabitans changchengi]
MDLISVREVRVARNRDDIVFAPGEQPLGGGTWLFSEEQDGLTGLVDLTGMGWPSITETDAALTISATSTIADLAALTPADLRSDPLAGGRDRGIGDARALFWQCANSLLASFKIWNVATVGGNIATALPAGPMTSLAAALDATAIIWTADDGERTLPVADLVTGVRQTALAPGEVLRAIEIPRSSLESRTGFRRIALSPLGRTGTMVIARASASGASPEVVFTVTGGTTRPVQLRFDEPPSAAALERALLGIDCWYTDPHGAADWRRAMSARFAEELRAELQ